MAVRKQDTALKAELGSTVIELGMGDATRAVRAEDLVARMAGRPERDGATLRLTSDDGSRLLIDVLRLLDERTERRELAAAARTH